ncbi:glycerol-3-phosphate O-acyltransferase [Coccomyxa subellipsoidea C-169]|uniref:Glycerol-3-phosphate acyltransferase, chloroplastic n=1 Tax=Coccomyxa subellipsoidea (strain C-169) TaxID=574566 RepID=I0YK90_COCSC|nr:glycerol-3-phosphate O-acyltransferase [Coccomyxa subellipsoidea C-169]EIE18809.1 glycerol-3-phosphate O-acyltransferase [Coccomyxa subellipsoidea C-169]|eukprot:XP_005643353.1 glycerol-3-phosphate O-acyltransferase [Coccomyxa subellipsoidea C-169]
MVLSVFILNCSPLPTIGAHQNRSLPLARWAVACRWTPVQARCSLPSRPRAKCRATTTCIAEVAPPRLGGFADVQSEAEFVAVLKAGVAAKKIPEPLLPGFLDFYNNYKTAVVNSGVPGADERRVAQVMGAIADRVCDQFVNPYIFPSFHERILEPYNYYQFGQNYVRNLVNFDISVVGHLDNFDKAAEYLARGDNVIMLANHQTEADPAVWALLLEKTHPSLATGVIYVAGDRVVTDPLCKPFSMGRNLFCVHSKKRMDDFPELKAEKQRTNRRTLAAMVKGLREGGKLLWIAPSGGRDRPNAEGTWMPAAFDPSSVDLMRTLLAQAKRPGHMFPLAMHSGEMMPPPPELRKGLGERRLTSFVGVGVCPILHLERVCVYKQHMHRWGHVVAQAAAFDAVTNEYTALEAAITDPAKRAAMADVYTQPWRQ